MTTEKPKCRVALLIIDMLNTFNFAEGEQLLAHARPVAERIRALKGRTKELDIPVLYVNDNFGQWRSDWTDVFSRCARSPGCDLADRLKPHDDDYFVLKPKHSGFYSTTLEVLLESLGVETLILTGIAGNICVLFTANDAHMREYKVIVPADCVASNTARDNDFALQQMGEVFRIPTTASVDLDLAGLKAPR